MQHQYGVNPTIVIQFGSLYSSILGIQPCTIMNNRCKNASWLQWMAVVGDPKYREDYSIYFDHRQLSNFTCNWDKEHACINLLKVRDESCCVCIESVRKHGTLRQWWMKAAGLTDSTMWWLYNNQQQHRLIAIPCDSWWASSFCHVYFLAMSGTYYYTDQEGFKRFKALRAKPKGFNSLKPDWEVYNYFKP